MTEAAFSAGVVCAHPKKAPDASQAEPFLKWAGGKRWLTQKIASLAPESYNRYIEPFLGGGAVFFSVAPDRAILSDLNPDLIEVYRYVRDQPDEIERCLAWLQTRHNKTLYYAMREREFSVALLRAARFIYLNRTCWNGLYRVNRQGKFNVPIGTKTAIQFANGLHHQSYALRNATLRCADFSAAIEEAGAGDFVYVDPPYTVRHNNNGFIKYNEHIFSWADQERLAEGVLRATQRGACVLVSNANHQSVRDLFSPLGDMIDVERASVIAGSSKARGRETELLVKCY